VKTYTDIKQQLSFFDKFHSFEQRRTLQAS